MTNAPPLRGEVWLIDLGSPIGHEAGMRRPAVVVSAHDFNLHGLATIAPITRTDKPYPTRIEIGLEPSGLTSTSYVQVEHLRTISTQRFERRLGMVGDEMARIDSVMRILLDL